MINILIQNSCHYKIINIVWTSTSIVAKEKKIHLFSIFYFHIFIYETCFQLLLQNNNSYIKIIIYIRTRKHKQPLASKHSLNTHQRHCNKYHLENSIFQIPKLCLHIVLKTLEYFNGYYIVSNLKKKKKTFLQLQTCYTDIKVIIYHTHFWHINGQRKC